MSVAEIKTNMTAETLLREVKKLPFDEYERFIEKAVRLRAKQKVKKLSRQETNLLLKINEGLPTDFKKRYDQLVRKRRKATLTEDEHSELIKLSDEIEIKNAKRIEYLLELARIRNKPLEVLMAELEIKQPPYD